MQLHIFHRNILHSVAMALRAKFASGLFCVTSERNCVYAISELPLRHTVVNIVIVRRPMSSVPAESVACFGACACA